MFWVTNCIGNFEIKCVNFLNKSYKCMFPLKHKHDFWIILKSYWISANIRPDYNCGFMQ